MRSGIALLASMLSEVKYIRYNASEPTQGAVFHSTFPHPVENFAGGHLKNWHKAQLYHIIHENVADF